MAVIAEIEAKEAEQFCAKIELLLREKYISREDYNEIGWKLCDDIEKIYGSLKNQGISVNDIVRKESVQ